MKITLSATERYPDWIPDKADKDLAFNFHEVTRVQYSRWKKAGAAYNQAQREMAARVDRAAKKEPIRAHWVTGLSHA